MNKMMNKLHYMWGLFEKVRSTEYEVVHASDLEALIPVLLAVWGRRTKVVFNIHDNWHLRYRLPSSVEIVVRFVEGIAAKQAECVIVPSMERLNALSPWKPSEAVVVPNAAIDHGFTPPPPIDGDECLRVGVLGWLAESRGINIVRALVKRSERVQLVIAGEGSAEIEAQLTELPNTEFHGRVRYEEAIELMRGCHLIAALYDPAVPINRLACPNKLADALSVGRGVIINSETEVSKRVEDYGCGVVERYHDHESIGGKLERLTYDDLWNCGRRARVLFEEEFHWALYEERVLAAFPMLFEEGKP